jgi:hypothetical protein
MKSLTQVLTVAVALAITHSATNAQAQAAAAPLVMPKPGVSLLRKVVGSPFAVAGMAAGVVGNEVGQLYKERCVSGGGYFNEAGTFFSGPLETGADGLILPCPAQPDAASVLHYVGMAADIKLSDMPLFKSTRKLRANMKAAGKGTVPKGCATHHIVPEKDSKKSPDGSDPAERARRVLGRCGIDLDDASNGVFLPNRKDESERSCKGAYHPKLHTLNYYLEVAARIVTASQLHGCDGARDALDGLRQELSNGHPDWALKGDMSTPPSMN